MEVIMGLPLHCHVTLSYANCLVLVSTGRGDRVSRAQTTLDAVLHLLTRLKDEGRTVTLAWTASHVGILGNVAADAEALRALTQDWVGINVPLSLQQTV